jgi:hypothetical protein
MGLPYALGLALLTDVISDLVEVLLRRRLVVWKPPSTDPTPLAHSHERTVPQSGCVWGRAGRVRRVTRRERPSGSGAYHVPGDQVRHHSTGGAGSFFEARFAPRHRCRGRLASPRPRHCSIPCRRAVAGRWMGARRIDPGRPLPRGGFAPPGASLRRGRPATEPDRTPGAKHASRRADHLLPIVGVVRGPGPRYEVRPAGQLRTRPCTSRPRSTRNAGAGRRRLGEPKRGHTWAAARITRRQASRSLLFHVDPVSTQPPDAGRRALL